MIKSTLRTVSVKLSGDGNQEFNESYENSGANSKGEFIMMMLNKWNSEPDTVVNTIEVEKKLGQNQVLFNLSQEQFLTLRSNVLSRPDFAERQNDIIDSLNSGRPLFYFGNLYDPEFKKIWVRNIPVKKEMPAEEQEKAIRHNMAAFLINMFLMHAIEGNFSVSNINASVIKTIIQKEAAKNQPPQQKFNPKENERVSN